jgi:hypothetical protein
MIRKKIKIREVAELGRALVFDGEVFDWGMDPEDLETARRICQNDECRAKEILGTIQVHFLTSLEQFLGTKVSLKELNKAIANGYIDL